MEDNKDLKDFIGDKFDSIDKRFNKVDEQHKELTEFVGGQFNKVWTEFDKMHVEFKNVHEEHTDLKSDFREFQTAMDEHAVQAKSNFLEITSSGSKLNRHDRWVNIIADKLGIKLPS